MQRSLRLEASFWSARLTEEESRRERALMMLLTMEEEASNIDVDPLALRVARQHASGRSGKGMMGKLALPPRRHVQGK
jgi:hypothetical protein